MNPVPGASVWEQAVLVSGALAELGVKEVRCGDRRLAARETDLPRELEEAGEGVRFECGVAVLVRFATGLEWEGNEDFARAMGGARQS